MSIEIEKEKGIIYTIFQNLEVITIIWFIINYKLHILYILFLFLSFSFVAELTWSELTNLELYILNMSSTVFPIYFCYDNHKLSSLKTFHANKISYVQLWDFSSYLVLQPTINVFLE